MIGTREIMVSLGNERLIPKSIGDARSGRVGAEASRPSRQVAVRVEFVCIRRSWSVGIHILNEASIGCMLGNGLTVDSFAATSINPSSHSLPHPYNSNHLQIVAEQGIISPILSSFHISIIKLQSSIPNSAIAAMIAMSTTPNSPRHVLRRPMTYRS